MIEIQNSKIIRDGEAIGTIVGDFAYVSSKPAPRIVGQIREAAGMPQLAFVVEEPPTSEESSEVQANEIAVTVDVPEQPAPVELPQKAKLPEPPRRPDMGDRDPVWQAWYIATHGETAFKARWPGRPMP